jgi:hypothetical protein
MKIQVTLGMDGDVCKEVIKHKPGQSRLVAALDIRANGFTPYHCEIPHDLEVCGLTWAGLDPHVS